MIIHIYAMHCLKVSLWKRVPNIGQCLVKKISSNPVAHLFCWAIAVGPPPGAKPVKAMGSGVHISDLQPFSCIVSPVSTSSVSDPYIQPTYNFHQTLFSFNFNTIYMKKDKIILEPYRVISHPYFSFVSLGIIVPLFK